MRLLDRYEDVVGHREVERLRRLGARLAGKRVVHASAGRTAAGLAEVFAWMIPLLQELGIDARWEVISGPPEFSRFGEALCRGLQGRPVMLAQRDLDLHRQINRESAERLDLEADVVFVHGPEPVFLPLDVPKGRVGRWVWQCHEDASTADRTVWRHLEGALGEYEAAVFSAAAFARPLDCPSFLVPPSIDPLNEKNGPLPEAERLATLARLGIDPQRPLVVQVSRFDRFHDPLGVLEAYRLVKRYYPELQFALAGGSAADEPESDGVLQEVRNVAGDDPDVKAVVLPPDSHRTINALQRSATIVLQKSVKEGFGFAVTEALWKGKPVVGGLCGGIPLQVHDYQTGFLVYSPAGAAYRIRWLLRYAEKRERMGCTGREFVRRHFLPVRHLRQYLKVLLCLDCPESRVVAV